MKNNNTFLFRINKYKLRKKEHKTGRITKTTGGLRELLSSIFHSLQCYYGEVEKRKRDYEYSLEQQEHNYFFDMKNNKWICFTDVEISRGDYASELVLNRLKEFLGEINYQFKLDNQALKIGIEKDLIQRKKLKEEELKKEEKDLFNYIKEGINKFNIKTYYAYLKLINNNKSKEEKITLQMFLNDIINQIDTPEFEESFKKIRDKRNVDLNTHNKRIKRLCEYSDAIKYEINNILENKKEVITEDEVNELTTKLFDNDETLTRKKQKKETFLEFINTHNELQSGDLKQDAFTNILKHNHTMEVIFKIPEVNGFSFSKEQFLNIIQEVHSSYFKDFDIDTVAFHNNENFKINSNQKSVNDPGAHCHYFINGKNKKTGKFDFNKYLNNAVIDFSKDKNNFNQIYNEFFNQEKIKQFIDKNKNEVNEDYKRNMLNDFLTLNDKDFTEKYCDKKFSKINTIHYRNSVRMSVFQIMLFNKVNEISLKNNYKHNGEIIKFDINEKTKENRERAFQIQIDSSKPKIDRQFTGIKHAEELALNNINKAKIELREIKKDGIDINNKLKLKKRKMEDIELLFKSLNYKLKNKKDLPETVLNKFTEIINSYEGEEKDEVKKLYNTLIVDPFNTLKEIDNKISEAKAEKLAAEQAKTKAEADKLAAEQAKAEAEAAQKTAEENKLSIENEIKTLNINKNLLQNEVNKKNTDINEAQKILPLYAELNNFSFNLQEEVEKLNKIQKLKIPGEIEQMEKIDNIFMNMANKIADIYNNLTYKGQEGMKDLINLFKTMKNNILDRFNYTNSTFEDELNIKLKNKIKPK